MRSAKTARPATYSRTLHRRTVHMIASMTGFARRETTGAWGTLVCELRSVNHRFLEAGFRLPDELRATEAELRARLTKQLRRGKVDCTPQLPQRRRAPTARCRSTPRRCSACSPPCTWWPRSLQQGATVNALDVLRWPGVLHEDASSGRGIARRPRATVFGETLEELVATRAREGDAPARTARAALRGTRDAGGAGARCACRRCRPACARASTSAWRN